LVVLLRLIGVARCGREKSLFAQTLFTETLFMDDFAKFLRDGRVVEAELKIRDYG
jgi:hypothetical protein